MKLSQFTRQTVQALTPYQSARRIGGKGDVWLNANEAPNAPCIHIDFTKLNRYPDAQPLQVVANYAAYAGVNQDQVLVSRGADEAIELIIRTFCEPGKEAILICPPTYGMYAISAQTCGVEIQEQPLLGNGQPDWNKLMSRSQSAKVIFLCSPNNPTGDLIEIAALERLLASCANSSLVVVDEAYIEFCPEHSVVGLLVKYPNLLITRTLSKAFALAGIRCGFTLAHPDLIAMLAKVIAPYPIAEPVAQIAGFALSDNGVAMMKARVNQLNEQKARFKQAIATLPIVQQIFADHGNFLLVRFDDSGKVFAAMQQAGVILRDFSSKPSLANTIRITIGNEAEMQATLTVLENLCVSCQANG